MTKEPIPYEPLLRAGYCPYCGEAIPEHEFHMAVKNAKKAAQGLLNIIRKYEQKTSVWIDPAEPSIVRTKKGRLFVIHEK